jgi:hypothetical protein
MGLESLVRAELAGEAPSACTDLATQIRQHYGGSLAAILFYGSCLRDESREGVLDFYAIVDDYRHAYPGRLLAWANAVLPPNVFYLEGGDQRAKVAVLSARDFARAAGPSAIRPAIWARFCQPFAIAHARDDAARGRVICAGSTAIRTAVARGLGLLRANGGDVLFTPEDFWTTLFRETYGSELRTESDDSVRRLYRARSERFDRVLDAVLDELAYAGEAEVERRGRTRAVRHAPELLSRPRRGRRIAAKAIGALQLLKSAFTFGDWMPYALWKLERHTGTRLEASERQLRHPFLFAWPLFFRVIARRELR